MAWCASRGWTWPRSGQTESVFALSNGHIGLRGNLDEGEPHATPGTYLNSFYETRPLPYAEGGYGYPESGQTIINVTNGKLIRLLVDDEPFDLRYGAAAPPRAGAGPAGRHAAPARSSGPRPAGRAVGCAATRHGVADPAGRSRRSATRSRCSTRPALLVRAVRAGRQRAAARRDERRPARGGGAARPAGVGAVPRPATPSATLIHQHPRSPGCGWPPRWTTRCAGPEGTKITSEAHRGHRPHHGHHPPAAGRRRCGSSSTWPTAGRRGAPSPRCTTRCAAALAAARYTGWDGLLAEQREYLDDFWATADVEIDGDAELQQAVRLAMFHVLQAGARAERRAIGAKGLTGDGYDGHTFWDTETFCLPVLSFTRARRGRATRCAGGSRSCRWPSERAEQLGLQGRGVPVADHPRPGVLRLLAGRHRGVPHQRRHRRRRAPPRATPPATIDFEREVGLELLVETARLWRSLGPPRPRGRVPHRRRHRPGRVHRDRRQQRLHEPHGAAEPARRRRRRGPALARGGPSSG